jgi:hypothetical protein
LREILQTNSSSSTLFNSIFKKKRIEPYSELEDYLSSSVARFNELPLKWWKQNEKSYPNLSKMAKDYLAIPGTSASCERLFSSGRQTITDFRCLFKSSVNCQFKHVCA